MRRLFTAAFLLGLLGLLAVPVAPAVADEPYGPETPTSCHVNAPSVKVGQRVVLRIEVSANTTDPIVGDVVLTISTASRAARIAARQVAKGVVWTRTVRYEGSPLEVTGPKLPRGSYRVTMAFTPDDGAFVPCRNAARFRVGAGGDTDGEEDDDGELPNTGGPERWPLYLGLGLLLAGSGLVGGSRRSRGTPAVA